MPRMPGIWIDGTGEVRARLLDAQGRITGQSVRLGAIPWDTSRDVEGARAVASRLRALNGEPSNASLSCVLVVSDLTAERHFRVLDLLREAGVRIERRLTPTQALAYAYNLRSDLPDDYRVMAVHLGRSRAELGILDCADGVLEQICCRRVALGRDSVARATCVMELTSAILSNEAWLTTWLTKPNPTTGKWAGAIRVLVVDEEGSERMVEGAIRAALVAHGISHEFGQAALESVALGAAVQGSILCGAITDTLGLLATWYEVALATDLNTYTMIACDTTIPTNHSQILWREGSVPAGEEDPLVLKASEFDNLAILLHVPSYDSAASGKAAFSGTPSQGSSASDGSTFQYAPSGGAPADGGTTSLRIDLGDEVRHFVREATCIEVTIDVDASCKTIVFVRNRTSGRITSVNLESLLRSSLARAARGQSDTSPTTPSRDSESGTQPPRESQAQTPLEEAMLAVLRVSGIGVLDNANRLLSLLGDELGFESPQMRVLLRNCDDEILAPLARAARTRTREALEDAESRMVLALTQERIIDESAAIRDAHALCSATARYLGT